MDSSAIEALERLGSLLERGLITQAEFDAKKYELLNESGRSSAGSSAEVDLPVEPHTIPFFPMSLDLADGSNGYVNRSVEWVLPNVVSAMEENEFDLILQLMSDEFGNPTVAVLGSGGYFRHNGVQVQVAISYIDDFSTQIRVDSQGGDVFGRSISKWIGRIGASLNRFFMEMERKDAVAGTLQNPRRFLPCEAHYWSLKPEPSSERYSRQLRMSLGDGQMLNTAHALCAAQAFSCTWTRVALEPLT